MRKKYSKKLKFNKIVKIVKEKFKKIKLYSLYRETSLSMLLLMSNHTFESSLCSQYFFFDKLKNETFYLKNPHQVQSDGWKFNTFFFSQFIAEQKIAKISIDDELKIYLPLHKNRFFKNVKEMKKNYKDFF